jgi:lysozyme
MKKIKEEYPDFLERLKFLIANSNVLNIESNNLKSPVKKEDECPDFVKQLENLIARSNIGINAIVDLSHWNENVDFKLAKEDGTVGIIHKATQGTKYKDPKYAERRKAAEDEGLLWGAYHFGVRGNGTDQADHF